MSGQSVWRVLTATWAAQDNSHPFVQAMVDFLIECNLRANRPGLLTSIMMSTTAKYEQDIKTMAELADESQYSHSSIMAPD